MPLLLGESNLTIDILSLLTPSSRSPPEVKIRAPECTGAARDGELSSFMDTRRAVRPPEHMRHLREADAAVPVPPRASPGVGTIARGLTLLYTPASEDTVQTMQLYTRHAA